MKSSRMESTGSAICWASPTSSPQEFIYRERSATERLAALIPLRSTEQTRWGAGTGAVLVTDPKYGDPSYGLGPVLFLEGGSHTIAIQGSLGGPPVFSKWEKLARAVHTHLG
jgi:hypothetical protein